MVARILTGALGLALLGSGAWAQDQPADEPPQSDAFLIGVEDQLKISLRDDADGVSQTVKVRPDGRISLPLIQDVEVAGRTPEEVRDILTARLSKYIQDPIVTVIVDEINSYRVYFLGAVTKPGPVNFYRPMRVLQAVASAGGPNEFAKKQITIVRPEFGVERRIEIDYKKLLEGDPSQENLYVKPGDTLIFK